MSDETEFASNAELTLVVEADEVATNIEAMVIDSPESFEEAGNAVLTLDKLLRKMVAYWKEPKAAAHSAHKAILAKETDMIAPVKQIRSKLALKVNGYLTEQNRLKREAQAKLDKEREAKEAEERARLEKLAIDAEKTGENDKAEELLTRATEVHVPVAVVEPVVPKTTRTIAGSVSQRADISIKVVDAKKVLQAVIDGVLPMSVVTISESKIKQAVKLNELTAVSGCEIANTVSASFRGSK